MIYSFKKE